MCTSVGTSSPMNDVLRPCPVCFGADCEKTRNGTISATIFDGAIFVCRLTFGDKGAARCGLWVVFGEPVLFDLAPQGFVFAGQDGRTGAAAVLDGVQARFGHICNAHNGPQTPCALLSGIPSVSIGCLQCGGAGKRRVSD